MTPEEQTKIIDIIHRLSALLLPLQQEFIEVEIVGEPLVRKVASESKQKASKETKGWNPTPTIQFNTEYGAFPLVWKQLVESHIKRRVPFLIKDITGQHLKAQQYAYQSFVVWCKSLENLHHQWDTYLKTGKTRRRFIFIPRYWENGKWHLASLQTYYEPAIIKGAPAKPTRWVEPQDDDELQLSS